MYSGNVAQCTVVENSVYGGTGVQCTAVVVFSVRR